MTVNSKENVSLKSLNNKINQSVKQLTLLAKQTFGIDIAVNKFLQESEYRTLVLDELYQLNDNAIVSVIEQIKAEYQQKNTIEKQQASQHIAAANHRKNPKLYLIALSIGLMGLIAFNAYYFLMQAQTQPSQVVSLQQSAQTISPALDKVNLPQKVLPITLPNKSAELVFKLHGSNTIGEKLAPALLKGYLKTQGVTEFYWLQGSNKVEKTLQYIKDNKAYAIELHAHGSSTAFKDLEKGAANMGMASRRIKSTEISTLKANFGQLDKVGNEHIVGLDGLAVIVNQNNPIKQLSTKTLARIFSGEITRWSQLGGEDKVINLFARDTNSGTWDTFKNLVLKKFQRKLAANALRFESSSELSTKVSQDEFAIGFIGLNFISHNKALAVSEGAGTKAIFPTRFTIGTEDYALSRRLYFYTPTNAANIVKDFAQFAIAQQGQEIVEQTGLISQNIKSEQVYPLYGAPKKYNDFAKKGQRLSLNYRFNYGANELDNKGKRDLQRLVKYMENNSNRRLVLMGFSDSIGKKVKNQKLSLMRAMSVERELIARGIPVMSVEGFGEALPIASNETAAGRERNRRVEVWLL